MAISFGFYYMSIGQRDRRSLHTNMLVGASERLSARLRDGLGSVQTARWKAARGAKAPSSGWFGLRFCSQMATTQYGPTDVADRVAPWRRIFSVKNEPIGFKVLGLRWTTEEAFAAFTSFTFAMVYALARRYMLRYIGE